MKWTRDKPSAPGWYWATFDIEEVPYMVLIEGSYPFFRVVAVLRNTHIVTKDVNIAGITFWAGPILEPGESE